MKLIWCEKCATLTSLVTKKVRYCNCRKCAGKYLKDNITSVTNKDALLVGIDNGTFHMAVYRYIKELVKYKERVDAFFCGWIPNLPGESIKVDTIQEVKDYPFEEYHNVTSTMPNSK